MAEDATSEIVEEHRPAERLRPQLRLHHLFALTAVAAVLLAISGPQQQYFGPAEFQPPPLIQTVMVGWSVLNVLFLAVAITAVAYGIVWQRRGLAFFDQPGHWLMVEIAVVGLFALVPAIIYRWIISSMDGGSAGFNSGDFPIAAMIAVGLYSLVVVLAFPLALNIYIGVKKCREAPWSWVFYIKAVANILMGLGHIAMVALLLVAVRHDRRQGIPRDASHWCGVWVQLALGCLYVVMMVFSFANMFYMMSRM